MKPKTLQKGLWSKSIHNFFSLKNQQYFWCESLLERDALLLLEFDSDISSYKTQPISIQYRDALGKVRRYTPDYLFKRKSDERFIFHEVKFADSVNDELKVKVALINIRLKESYGSKLEIITSNEIRVGSRIENLSLLYPYKRVLLDDAVVEDLKNSLPARLSYGDLVEHAKNLGSRDILPMAILAKDILSFDTKLPLSFDTEVFKK